MAVDLAVRPFAKGRASSRTHSGWGRRLLTAAVLTWFAILILAPTIGLIHQALAGDGAHPAARGG